MNQTRRLAGHFGGEINDKASACRRERVRAAQRCDPTDEMRGSPDLPDALLESRDRDGRWRERREKR